MPGWMQKVFHFQGNKNEIDQIKTIYVKKEVLCHLYLQVQHSPVNPLIKTDRFTLKPVIDYIKLIIEKNNNK